MKNLLVDGTNLAHIHFAANPSLDDNGNPVGIIRGFIGALARINKLFLPDRAIVFFDGTGGSAQRRQLYKGYKEGRKPRTNVGQYYKFSSEEAAQKNYDWQISKLKQLLEACAVCVIDTEYYETDDGIAYLVSSLFDEEHVIVSCDKDFYQLIEDGRVSIYNPIMKKEIKSEYVLEQFSVHPINWLFYRSITGDSSDNIDGVKGFGPKTIKKLFSLDKEIPMSLSRIDQISDLLTESKLDKKEKTLEKRIMKLKNDKKKLERNWKLMDLKDPLMPQISKNKIDFALSSFSPSISTKDFYMIVADLGIQINPMITSDFVRLTNVKL